MSKRNVWLPFVLLAVFSFSAFASSKSTSGAKDLYEKAMQAQQSLNKSSSLQSQLTQWKKVADAFRAVYYKYPSSAYCDNALFQVGSLYASMGDRFQDTLYLHRAASTFQFLIDEYSSSSLRQDAMLEYIRIMRLQLKQDADAAKMEAAFRKQYPRSIARLPRIQTAPAQAAAPSEAAPSSAVPSGKIATLSGLRHYTGPDYSRVVLDFDQEVSFKRNRLSNPDRLYLDFENTTAPKALMDQATMIDDGFLKQVRVGRNTETRARVVLDLQSIDNYEVFALYHPYRLVIDIQGKKSMAAAAPSALAPAPPSAQIQNTTIAPQTIPSLQPAIDSAAAPSDIAVQQPAPEMAQKNSSGNYSLARQLGLKVRRIVVDPGHGGHDPGAMHNGLIEKNITLDVALRLKQILADTYGYEVLMTRGQDRYVALEERTAFANSNGADLFVSVHVNSSRNKSARGAETYYLNFATSPEAMEVAARENAIAEKNMGELQKLTSAIALNSKIEESRDFASQIQANLVGHLRKDYSIHNLGVKQAPFYVLIGAHMPSILAEISFISNSDESDLLAKPSYRQQIAEGLADGVRNYVETLAAGSLTQNIHTK